MPHTRTQWFRHNTTGWQRH